MKRTGMLQPESVFAEDTEDNANIRVKTRLPENQNSSLKKAVGHLNLIIFLTCIRYICLCSATKRFALLLVTELLTR